MIVPSNAELPFVSQRKVDDLLLRMLRRQPEGESAEIARLKLLEEFDEIIEHIGTSSYKHMTGITEELEFIGYEMTRYLEYVSGLRPNEQVMAGRGSAIMTIDHSTGDFEFGQVPPHEQLHGRIDRIEAIALNYDLTPITSTAVPRGIVYKPLIVLSEAFTLDERTAEVNDFPEGDHEIMLPLDDDTLDLRKSLVVHEPHKSEVDL